MPDPSTPAHPARPSPTRLNTSTIVVAALLAGLPAIATGLHLIQDPAGRGLLNPDSAMRLVRLEDILAAHAPLHTVMRDGSGTGAILHWSHLLDSLLLLLAVPFQPFLGWPDALHLAGLAFGPLCLGALGIAIAWACAPVAAAVGAAASRQGLLCLGAFAAAASVSVHGYGMMGVVHHHVLLAMAAVLSAGWALRILRGHDPRSGGIALGAVATAGLWLSPEALPFCLVSIGAVGIGWLTALRPRRATLGTALFASGATLAILATLAWLVDPPAGGLSAIEMDRLSLPLVLIGVGTALVGTLAALTGHRLATLSATAALVAAWLTAFPNLLHGTSGLLTPDQVAVFLGPITEMQPIRGIDRVLWYLSGGLFAVVALGVFAWQARRTPAGSVLIYAAACVLGAVALATGHMRFAAYPSLAGAAMLTVVLAAISASRIHPGLQSLGRVTVAVGLLTLPLLAPLTATAAQSDGAPALQCLLAGAASLLASHPGEVVLAGVNETPDILYRTRALTVGSLYHRNPEAFMRLRAAWRIIPTTDGPPPEFRATRATLILGCPGGPRSALLEGLPTTTLLDRLNAGNPPPWLHRIADAGPGGYVLYGVAQ